MVEGWMKGSLRMHWSRIHQEKTVGPLSVLLVPFSGLYGAGVGLRLAAYRAGLFKSRRLPGFVISVGNLTAGGTGKTPAVIMLAEWVLKVGRRVAVLSRGHGGSYKGKILEVSDGNRVKARPSESGDEPYLLATRLRGVPVVISNQRYLAGMFARKHFGSEVFILDDGFQHLELERDLNLVLIDASSPFGNGHLLPRGPLREPLRQLERGDVFILTRSGAPRKELHVRSFLQENFPGRPVYNAVHRPEDVVFPFGGKRARPEVLRGKRVLAFAGIARPAAFRETLLGLGAEVEAFMTFGDHHPFTRDEIEALIERGKALGVNHLVTTEKDWVRLAPLAPRYEALAYLTVGFALPDGRGEFFEMVENRMRKGGVH